MDRPKVSPVVWSPPTAPARARQQLQNVPASQLTVLEVNGTGPEDVAIDDEGWLLTGVTDGRILRMTADGSRIDTVAHTGGRPLGIEVLADGRLIVCDAYRGLLRVDPDRGEVETLVDEFGGEPLKLCDNAAVGADGTVYFSDSSRRFGFDHWRADLLEHSGTGRLLRRDPAGAVDVLADGLQFANGVALAADESFVAVAETGAYRISRVWLTGPKAGQQDVLIDNLPGFPDNLSTGSAGRIWVAIPSPRNPLLDWAHGKDPRVRQAMWALPTRLQPRPQRTTWVLALDAAGTVLHDLQADGQRYHMVTGVRERDGKLYLGSLAERAVAVVEAPIG